MPDSDPSYGSGVPNRVWDNYGTVGGGYSNHAGRLDPTDPAAPFATVGGGQKNQANWEASTVSGGTNNKAQHMYATVAGGTSNSATGNGSAIMGGHGNIASGFASGIAGGFWNEAKGRSSITAAGEYNRAHGQYSATVGGHQNCAGADLALAAGRRAKVRPGSNPMDGSVCAGLPNYPGGDGDLGTFVWADSQNADFVSTGSNQFLVRAQGGVGLGTNAPQNQLHVAEDVNDWAAAFNHVAQIQNTSTGSSPDVLALKIGTLGNPAGSVNFITFIRGDDTSLGTIEGDGAGGVTFAGPGNDYAEWLPLADRSEAIGPGQIVGWTPEGIRLRTQGALRLMVVSTQPIVAGNAPMGEDRSGHAPVAFVGQAPVNVIGPVTAGDWIIASGRDDGSGVAVPGAMLGPDQHALIVGRALESSNARERRPVRTLIGLGQEALLGHLARDNATLRERVAQLEAQQARIADLESRLAALTAPAALADAANR
ncbi:MAG: hypothetical protein HYV17_03810 [Xanthomonadales bacterium]|nr:hypothetical protein [Xanthomonadales bacterium]